MVLFISVEWFRKMNGVMEMSEKDSDGGSGLDKCRRGYITFEVKMRSIGYMYYSSMYLRHRISQPQIGVN